MQHFVDPMCAAFNEDPDDCSILSQCIDLDSCSLSIPLGKRCYAQSSPGPGTTDSKQSDS